MNIQDILHKRILVAEKTNSYSGATVIEIKILEISPSEKWTKIQNQTGNKYWKMTSDIVPIEVLASLETNPNK